MKMHVKWWSPENYILFPCRQTNKRFSRLFQCGNWSNFFQYISTLRRRSPTTIHGRKIERFCGGFLWEEMRTGKGNNAKPTGATGKQQQRFPARPGSLYCCLRANTFFKHFPVVRSVTDAEVEWRLQLHLLLGYADGNDCVATVPKKVTPWWWHQ